MKNQKPIWKKNKYGKWYKLKPVTDKITFIPCDEFDQTYRWQKTNKGYPAKRLK
tara:strand:- start:452 stop:613 length:162 start_codon:yes stop_codon:yes gene_type:complete